MDGELLGTEVDGEAPTAMGDVGGEASCAEGDAKGEVSCAEVGGELPTAMGDAAEEASCAESGAKEEGPYADGHVEGEMGCSDSDGEGELRCATTDVKEEASCSESEGEEVPDAGIPAASKRVSFISSPLRAIVRLKQRYRVQKKGRLHFELPQEKSSEPVHARVLQRQFSLNRSGLYGSSKSFFNKSGFKTSQYFTFDTSVE